MNLNDEPSSNQLRDLLRPCDDSLEHVVWVDWDGFVSIKSFKKGEIPILWIMARKRDIRFHLETFHENEGRVGPKAVSDPVWVKRVMHTLMVNWEKNSEGYVGIEKL